MAEITVDRLGPILPSGMAVTGALVDGTGGQGTVFRGTCNGEAAAIKVFRPDSEPRRIDREIDLLSKMNCPHVVRLLQHAEAELEGEDLRILAYELHTQGDLRSHLAAGAAPVAPTDLIQIGMQVSTAIEALWTPERIVHRDIKPPNIVRADDGRYVLVDVGFARHVDRSDITVYGSPGTRGFRSPEQAMGRRNLTIRSDTYSLGVTLFLLATKRHPFMNSDITSPTPINTTPLTSRGDLPPELIQLIAQMLSFVAAKRPPDLSSRFAALGGTTCSL